MLRIIGYLVLMYFAVGLLSYIVLSTYGIEGAIKPTMEPVLFASGVISIATAIIGLLISAAWVPFYRRNFLQPGIFRRIPDWIGLGLGSAVAIYLAELKLDLSATAPLWHPIIFGALSTILGYEIGKKV